MMVYCKLMSHDGHDNATYAFGSYTGNMTGKITFFSGGRIPIIEKQPEGGPVSKLWIGKLMYKYRDSLSTGDFRENMAYEC